MIPQQFAIELSLLISIWIHENQSKTRFPRDSDPLNRQGTNNDVSKTNIQVVTSVNVRGLDADSHQGEVQTY